MYMCIYIYIYMFIYTHIGDRPLAHARAAHDAGGGLPEHRHPRRLLHELGAAGHPRRLALDARLRPCAN